jgi:flagellar biosynthetic protein FliQ
MGTGMTQDTVINLATQAMTLGLEVAGPILLVGLVIGLAVSLFQAVTQIQEQSLSFIPKIVGLALLIVILGPWMLDRLVNYVINLYMSIPSLVG